MEFGIANSVPNQTMCTKKQIGVALTIKWDHSLMHHARVATNWCFHSPGFGISITYPSKKK